MVKKNHGILVFLGSTLLFGAIGFLVHYMSAKNYEFLFSSYDSLLATSGMSDAGSYLLGGRALSEQEMLGEHRWILTLWPPGMAHLYSLFISAGLPIALTMLVVTSAAYGVTLTLLYWLIYKTVGWKTAVLGVGIGVLNPFAIASLGPSSLLYSDGLGASLTALMTLAWLPWTSGLLSGRTAYFHSVLGVVFALSSLMVLSLRWSMVPIVGILWIVSGLVGGWAALREKKLRVSSQHTGGFEFAKATLVAGATGMPWTIYVATTLHPPNPFWSVGTDYVWAHRWLRDDDLPGFLVSGNANWACDLNRQQCENLRPLALEGGTDFTIFRDAAFNTILGHPLGFLSTGAVDFFRGFFSAPFTGVGLYSNWYFSAISAFLILSALALVVLRKNWVALSSVLIVLFGVFVVVAMYHVESRYFLPLHYFAFIACIYLIFARNPHEHSKYLATK